MATPADNAVAMMTTDPLTGRSFPRAVVRGKFLWVGPQKFYMKGVTYGPFAPDKGGSEYGSTTTVDADFAAMSAHGINTVRTYTIPPRWLLDLAQKHGLRMMVGLPWEEHIAFLDDKKRSKDIIDRCRKMVRTCSGHPALLAITIGNEIPATIVRWHGAAKVERFLHRLYRMVKREDAQCLVTYVNFPTTEYLRLPFVDFVSFNVYLEQWDKLNAYLAKLQSHAEDRPLVMAELGLDSIRNGEHKQADSLSWQLRAGFDAGCAGVFVFAWTDEWYRGGAEITDWSFGLTTRERQPKPALAAVQKVYAQVPFPMDRPWPKISVVVCTYNGKRLIRDCCEGLREVTYPNFEVLMVDDGSTDGVGEIPKEFGFKVIRTPNQGLSRARNVGMENASGEIIAYLDDDARPDPHWLHYLAHTYMTSNHVAVGGPNIPPPGDGPIADCVANAPGGPIHVLITDEIAEHIPGCNFSVRRDALMSIQGFDGTFRIAGDDVDCCWRLQDAGGTIGFSPAAMVWHHRRNSMKAYLKQQTNYGRAEAMLEKKWPGKYNAAGHIPWTGKIYGRGALQMFRLAPARIYQGMWGLAPFQSLYEPAPGLASLLPAMPDWYLIIATLAVISFMGSFWPPLLFAFPLLLLAVVAPIHQATMGGVKAVFINKDKSLWRRLWKHALTALLHLLQPMVRFYGRTLLGLHPLRQRGAREFVFPKSMRLAIWREKWSSPEQHLFAMEDALEQKGAAVRRGGDFDNWDLRVSGGLLGGARLRMAIEEHGQGKQQLLFRVWPTWSPVGLGMIALFFMLAWLAGLFAWKADNYFAYVPAVVLGAAAFFGAVKAFREAGTAVGAIVATISPVVEAVLAKPNPPATSETQTQQKNA